MRWCEDLLWDHSEFPHKSQLCSILKVEFLQHPSRSLLDFWYGSSARISSTWARETGGSDLLDRHLPLDQGPRPPLSPARASIEAARPAGSPVLGQGQHILDAECYGAGHG